MLYHWTSLEGVLTQSTFILSLRFEEVWGVPQSAMTRSFKCCVEQWVDTLYMLMHDAGWAGGRSLSLNCIPL